MNKEASSVIRQHFNCQPNFMTPNVLIRDWLKVDKLAYELSQGLGFYNESVFGVTVVEVKGEQTENRLDLSSLFNSKSEAFEYIDSLKR